MTERLKKISLHYLEKINQLIKLLFWNFVKRSSNQAPLTLSHYNYSVWMFYTILCDDIVSIYCNCDGDKEECNYPRVHK